MPSESTNVEQPALSNTYRLHEFDLTSYDWDDWEVLFDTYIAVEGITDDIKKRNLLITALAVQPFKTLISVCKPKKPTECTYQELIHKLRTNYARVTFPSTERIKFFATRQESSQSLTDFANSLRDKSVTCKFPNDFYEDSLVTAFVGGLKNEHVRKYLMQQNLETFEQTLNAARIFESVLTQGANVKDHLSEDSYILEIQQNDKSNKKDCHKSICLSCGSTDHPRSQCRFRHVTCHKCNKAGHIAKVCRSKQFKDNNIINTIRTTSINTTSSTKSIQLKLLIDDIPVKLQLDTGSPITLVDEQLWKQLGCPALQPVHMNLNSFTGHPVKLKGQKVVNVKYKNQYFPLNLHFFAGVDSKILGLDWIHALHINSESLNDIVSTNTISNVNINHEIKKLKNMMIHYSNMFKDISWNLKQQLKNVQDLLRSTIINTSNNEHSLIQDKVYIDDFRGASTKVKLTPENLIHQNDNQIRSPQWSDNKDAITDGYIKLQLEHGTCSATPQHNSSDQDTRTFQHSSKYVKKKGSDHHLIEEN